MKTIDKTNVNDSRENETKRFGFYKTGKFDISVIFETLQHRQALAINVFRVARDVTFEEDSNMSGKQCTLTQ